MRFLSLFSGIEAASAAWHPIGWECVGVAEIEPFPCAVLKHHYPKVPNLGSVTDITEQQIKALGQIDLVVGGFPCQDLSVAGKRKGLRNTDGSQTRSGLFYDAMRIVQWTNARWLVLENVPGMFSSNQGKDFASVVGELLGCEFDVPRNGWENAGVAASDNGLVEWAVLDAQYFGVAQRRRRCFIIRDTGNWAGRPPIFLERHSLSGHPAPSRQARKGTAGSVASGATASGWPADVSPTLNAHFGSKQGLEDQHVNGGGDCLCPPVAMCLITKTRLDSETETLIPTAGGVFDAVQPTAYNITFCDANGVRSDRPNGGLYVNETDVSSTLTEAGVGTNVVQPVGFYSNLGSQGGGFAEDASVTLKAATSNNLAAVAIQGTLIGRGENAGPQGSGADVSGAMFTLTKADVHAVAFAQNQVGEVRTGEVLNTLNTNSNASGRNTPMVAFAFDPGQSSQPKATHQFCIEHTVPLIKERVHAVASTTMQVRRLTPVECERLQGFPDGYTNIPWRGKDESPDGPRYKALGNSMAVPVMRWIGERINEVSKL